MPELEARYPVDDRRLVLVEGDITRQIVDAIVNAANSGLLGGGGVDGAIHRAGGPSIMKECRRIGGCPTGGAVVTGAGELPCDHVIHAVGPRWRGGDRDESRLLASAYRESLARAEELGVASVALPSLSTGAYGFPMATASRIALETVAASLRDARSIREARFVLFGRDAFSTFRSTADELFGS